MSSTSTIMRKLFPPFLTGSPAVGLLLLRLIMGAAFVLHGLSKIQNPTGWMGDKVPGALQALAAISEFGGGLALILGLLTPLAALGLMCTMFVAVLTQLQKGAPFVGNKGPSWEAGGVYFVIALMLVLTGPGALSLDALLFGRNKR